MPQVDHITVSMGRLLPIFELQRIKLSNRIILSQHWVSRGCVFELYFKFYISISCSRSRPYFCFDGCDLAPIAGLEGNKMFYELKKPEKLSKGTVLRRVTKVDANF